MKALLLEPHADDAVLFSCWNLLRYRPKVVTVLRSDRMADPRYPGGPVLHEQRLYESGRAFGWLDVEWEQWEFSDVDPDWPAIHDRLQATPYRPDVVIAPAWESGGHDDHNRLSDLADIFQGLAPVIHYLTYTRSNGRSRNGTEVEFEPGWPILKLRALHYYGSQIRHPATAPHFLEGLREYVA